MIKQETPKPLTLALLDQKVSQDAVMRYNEKHIRRFLKKLEPHVHLVAIPPDGGKIEARHFGFDLEAAELWCIEKTNFKWNVYYTVNAATPGLDEKPTKKEIIGVRFAHLDLDPPKDGSSWDIEKVIAELQLESPPPSEIVRSGYGVQALWPVVGASPAQIEGVNRGLIKRFGGDSGTHNVDRLLRVPGTTNYPNKKKRAMGRQEALAELVTTGINCKVPYDLEALVIAYADDIDGVLFDEEEQLEVGDYELINADNLGLPSNDYLRKLIDDPKGVDRSSDSYALACEMLRRGFSPEQVMGLLLNCDNPVSAHCLDQDDEHRAAVRTTSKAMAEIQRRKAQRYENQRIGEGEQPVPTARVFSLDEMLSRFVFIKDGSQVADLVAPQLVQSLADFKNAMAASKHEVRLPDGRLKEISCWKAWLEHPDRMEVDAVTFHAGAPAITIAPQGSGTALNTWCRPKRGPAPGDWMERAAVFVDHVSWLWGEHAAEFLDFLAHAEQKPGELPHFGWIHVSREHGKGRNWIAGVIARLWSGNVASSLDLMSILEDGFNARLSRCLFGIVDEIYEGGNQSYRHAQALKQAVTPEHREINPKYGRRHVEYNSVRWMFFSNHSGAIPLGEEDRRFYVVEHDGPAHEPAYYERLYGCLGDPLFIRAVAEFLSLRDVSGFRPGKRPPMTAAKSALIGFSRTEDDEKFQELARYWPVEIISGSEFRSLFDHDILKRSSTKYAMDRAGIRKLKKIRIGGTPEMVYTLCDHACWTARSPQRIKSELESVAWERKLELMERNETTECTRL